jgi:hypothetical protein
MGAAVADGGLGFTGPQIAWVGSAFAIASIVGIFFSSQFADRTFAAEKFMAASHFIGGLAILGMYWAKDFPTFFGLMLVHSLLYVPTISVSNSIAFTHMKNAEKEFGLVRMGGTIGWILAAWPLFFLLEGKTGVAATTAKATAPGTPWPASSRRNWPLCWPRCTPCWLGAKPMHRGLVGHWMKVARGMWSSNKPKRATG